MLYRHGLSATTCQFLYIPGIELPKELAHLLAIVIHLSLLVGRLQLRRTGTCLMECAQAVQQRLHFRRHLPHQSIQLGNVSNIAVKTFLFTWSSSCTKHWCAQNVSSELNRRELNAQLSLNMFFLVKCGQAEKVTD